MPVNPSHVNPLDCNEVSEQCPVEASIYGYYPTLGSNAFFSALFGLCFIINLGLGWRYRTWSYMTAMTLACISSCIGYVGRCLMHRNPYDSVGFEIQICCLTFAPAFNAAAIYLILKHLVLQIGRQWSRIRPKYYTWAFIIADFLALTLQAAGGGIAGSAGDDESFRDVGDRLMITGISWQVLTLLIFGVATSDYSLRRFKSQPLSESTQALVHDLRFRVFVVAQLIAYVAILIRCVYRVAEMANGWRNPIMQNQGLFIGLDSSDGRSRQIGVATILQTFIHPGYFFPALADYGERKKARKTSNVTEDAIHSESHMDKAMV
ncbi:putative RTA1 domain protein [Fonsecaea pedrosoi]|nr:putative RTA1 domain protein [Fonsecaea pedrosoi]